MQDPLVILDPHFRRVEQLFDHVQLERLQTLANVFWGHDEPLPKEDLMAVRDKVTAIITGSWRYGSVDLFPHLKAVIEVAGGFPYADVFDYETCFKKSIRVMSCAPGFAQSVAELALGLALCSARGIMENAVGFRSGNEIWGSMGNSSAFLISGKPVGFIGYGNIGRALKNLLSPFRCPIRVYDPWLTNSFLCSEEVVPSSLEQALSDCKIIFLIAAPSIINRQLVDRAKLELIAPDALFVLISRAHLVDFEALTELVSEGRFRAAIDVFPQEPIPQDHPIRKVSGALLSAHRAGGTPEAYKNIGRMVVNDLDAVFRGLRPQELQLAEPEYIANRGIGWRETV